MTTYRPTDHRCLVPNKDDARLGTISECDECGRFWLLDMPYPGIGLPMEKRWVIIKKRKARRLIKKMKVK